MIEDEAELCCAARWCGNGRWGRRDSGRGLRGAKWSARGRDGRRRRRLRCDSAARAEVAEERREAEGQQQHSGQRAQAAASADTRREGEACARRACRGRTGREQARIAAIAAVGCRLRNGAQRRGDRVVLSQPRAAGDALANVYLDMPRLGRLQCAVTPGGERTGAEAQRARGDGLRAHGRPSSALYSAVYRRRKRSRARLSVILAAAGVQPSAVATSANERPYTSRSTSAARGFGGSASSVVWTEARTATRQAGSLAAGSRSSPASPGSATSAAWVACAPMVEREIGGDAPEPGFGPLVAAHFGDVLPGTQERLLAQIRGDVPVAGHAPEVAEDPGLAPLEQ